MTIGQRVAQKRKEQGLSQEALGEVLGVSRQSVYKWESDNTLPEIDKLIAMSKLFGVTIGWLLGVEEPVPAEERQDAGEEPSPPPAPGEAELTDTQLKMVEEIVDRYLAAQQPVKKKRWPWVAGVVAGLVLLGAISSLRTDIRNMRRDYSNLQNSITSISWDVDKQIGSITYRVEQALKNQNNLTVSYGAEVVSGDLAANTVTFSAYAAPKTYTDGMTAVFLVDNGRDAVEVPGTLNAGQTFSAELTCAITNDISLSVVFVTGDVRETQLLEQYYGLYSSSLPDVVWPEIIGVQFYMDKKTIPETGDLTWSSEQDYAWFLSVSSVSAVAVSPAAADADYDFGRVEAKSIRVGLFRNQVLLDWLTPCEKPDSFWDIGEDYEFFTFPDVSVKPEKGDEFRLCTVVEDEYGREFVYKGLPYVLDQDMTQLVLAEGGEIGLCDAEGWVY